MRGSWRTCSTMSWRAVSASERWTSRHLRARSRELERVERAAVAAADHHDVTPDEVTRPGLEQVRHVAAEGTVLRRGELLVHRARRDHQCPSSDARARRLRSIAHRGRRAVTGCDRRRRSPRIAAESAPRRRAGPDRRGSIRWQRLRTECGISTSWPPGRSSASNTAVSSWMSKHSSAQLTPAVPAPTMTTSCCSSPRIASAHIVTPRSRPAASETRGSHARRHRRGGVPARLRGEPPQRFLRSEPWWSRVDLYAGNWNGMPQRSTHTGSA